MADRIGQQLGNYQLIRLLGNGGFADVYLGQHIYLKTPAAIKVLHTYLTDDTLRVFLGEAQAIARMTHPHIIRVLEFGVDGNTPFLVMEYAPNGTLRQHYPKGTHLPLHTIVSHVKQLAEALQYAHDSKVIHRDVKPENILLGRNNEVLLSDFGIATIAQTSRSLDAQEISGTAAYMAPEQIQGRVRPASDQYSLAVIVYEWLTGSCPFQGSFLEIASQHMVVPPPPLRRIVPTISPDVEEVVLMALSKDPQYRFMTIRAFAYALEQASQAPISSFPTASPILEHPAADVPTWTPLAPTIVTPLSSHTGPTLPASEQPSSPSPDFPGASTVKEPSESRISRRLVILGLGGLVIAGGGIAAWLALSQKPLPPSHAIGSKSSSTALPTSTPTTAPTPTATSSPKTAPPALITPLTYRGQSAEVYTVAWAPRGTHIASAGHGQTVQVWDVTTGNILFSYNSNSSKVFSVRWSPDGTRIASGHSDGTVQVWNASNGNPLLTYSGHTPQTNVNAVAWSPDGRNIASGSGDRTVQVWDATTGHTLFTYRGHSHYVNAVAWSSDGKHIVSGGGDDTAQVWDAITGTTLLTYTGHSSDVVALGWSPDSNHVASASNDTTAQVWSISGNTLFTYRGHTDFVVALAWSPNGARIASAGVDTTVQVWDAVTGSSLFVHRGHAAEVEAVTWSPDSAYIASASDDMTVQVWKAS